MTTAAAIPGVNSAFSMNSSGAPQELFALTDEQILEIEPVAQGESTSPAGVPESRSIAERSEKSPGLSPRATNRADAALSAITDSAEPPPWLAAQMKDLWNGDEARDLWDGVQQARQEAAAFREVFAKPEDARAIIEETRGLKELYPGGVDQARAAAERSRTLEEIDSAFY